MTQRAAHITWFHGAHGRYFLGEFSWGNHVCLVTVLPSDGFFCHCLSVVPVPEDWHDERLLVLEFRLSFRNEGFGFVLPWLFPIESRAGLGMQRHGNVIPKRSLGGIDFYLPAGIVLLPALVPRHIPMDLALVEEEAGVAEGAIRAEGTAEFPLLGVLAVLVVEQGLLVFGLVAAILALEDGHLVVLRVLRLHVLLQFVLALAGKAAHLTDQGLALVA